MKNCRLTRISSSTKHGTFGVLTINGLPSCVTLEPYNFGNRKNESCIPTGQYICKKTISPRFGTTFTVTDVAGRSHIVFHVGNTIKDTDGCILLGNNFGTIGIDHAILSSRDAVNDFIHVMKDVDVFLLTIVESF